MLGEIKRENLQKHINYLASQELAGRFPDTEGIEKAKNYIKDQFKAAGLKPLKPLSDKDFEQKALFTVVYQENIRNKKGLYQPDYSKEAISVEDKGVKISNLIGFIPAKRKTDKFVFLTAHYDHLGRDVDTGKVYPGADDNASGVAALLEIARVLGKYRFDKNVVFVATSGEETKCLGSKYLAKQLKINGFSDKIEVVNLDCLAANGRFVAIEGWDSEQNQRLANTAKKMAVKLKIPSRMEDFETNSHTDAAIFDKEGFPAISLVWAYDLEHKNRKHLHEPTDTPDKVNYDSVEKSTRLAMATIHELAAT